MNVRQNLVPGLTGLQKKIICRLAGNSNGKFSDTNSSMALKNVCPQNRSFWGLSCLLMFLTIQALTANLLKFYQMGPKRLLSKEIL